MNKVKISSLSMLDEKKFKKLADERNDWLNTGEDVVISLNSIVNEKASILRKSQYIVKVKKIIKEGFLCKSIVLESVTGEMLPMFNAGQKVSLTVNKDDKYITKPYTIISSPIKSIDGEYVIAVLKDTGNVVDEYLFNDAKLEEKFIISVPFGDFYYNSIRDCKNIVAIVSDDGIFSIYAMVQAIIDRTCDFNLDIFYTVKKEVDILFKEELEEYANNSSKIKINFLVSDEKVDGCINGFVTSDMIQNIIEKKDVSIFISGKEGLLKYLDKELEILKIPKKFIRYENFLPRCGIKRVIRYNMTIYVSGEKYVIPCYNNKTIMEAIFDGGIYIPSKCQNGSCGFCKSELVLGEVKIVNDKRTIGDKKYNYIHPCCTYPLSDIEIIVR